eukprot:m.310860 g.310860  ORF g.310860 m.310860 type:complete len:303 (+) comp55713_c0_seq1:53-961(+)
MSKTRVGSRVKPKGPETKESSLSIKSVSTTEREIVTSEPDSSLSWQFLSSPDQVQELRELNPPELARELAGILQLKDSQSDLGQAALLDSYVAAFWFTKEQDFSHKSSALFMGIIHHLATNCRLNCSSLTQNIEMLKQLTPEFDAFSSTEQPLALHYIHQSFFQHCKLYQYLFTASQKEEVLHQSPMIESPCQPGKLDPPPLEEAITEDTWAQHVQCLVEKTTSVDHNGGNDQEVEDEHLKEGTAISAEVNPLKNIPEDQLKKIMTTVAETAMEKFEAEMKKKLADWETAFSNRIEKLEKRK